MSHIQRLQHRMLLPPLQHKRPGPTHTLSLLLLVANPSSSELVRALSMAAMMTYGTSSSSSSPRWKYDVFLSFCGKDTRKNFTDHLYRGLDQAGIHTFRDDEELEKGEDISSELMDAIEASRIAIVVFSENYASSTWCLNELAKIIDCKKYGQTERVLPVFHKVDPSDVRKQSNTYADAFVRHEVRFKEEMGKVVTWKAALTEAANLSGWDQLHVADGHESKLIKKIVREVLTRVNQTHLHVAAYPIGLDSHMKHIGCLLNDRLDVVRVVGIHGLGGIGKTTIAKAVFNEMFQKFEGCSFLANVREVSSQQNGLALLQTQLLSDVLKGKNISISNEDRGIIIIKERLCCKRVLIVLDDVDKREQLDKLVGEHGWFGLGSRIIVTTIDEHLLNRPEVDEKYKVETMDQNESLQLFSCHAFRQNHPLEGYMELSNDIVHYAAGLPLALVILGSLLLDKRSQVEWESELEKLRKIPNYEILKILEIGYDALDDFNRNIFLDISCLFIGRPINLVIPILDACGLCPKAGIRLLIQRSLVTIGEYNQLQMHDLIQEMGKEIVRKQSPQNPGERSRLWLHDDALDVLANLTGTGAVECLEVDLSKMWEKRFQLTTEAFFKMPNLRLLQIYGEYSRREPIDWEHFHDHRVFFFRKLVWVFWGAFPFKYIPDNFHLGNLVSLHMPQSQLKEVWKGTKFLPKLKDLDLSHSYYLTCTPDFSGLPNLEKLFLSECWNLVEVHESIDHLSKLDVFILRHCRKLRNLPSSISKLASLETFDITGCSQLEELPEGIGNLTRLRSFRAVGTAIEELPSSFKLLKNLTTFKYSAPIQSHSSSLGACFFEILKKLATCCFAAPMPSESSSIRSQSSSVGARERNSALLSASLYGFHSLRNLDLGGYNLTDDDIPDDLWKLCSLKLLDLSNNDFLSLPSSICQLSELETLRLWGCKSLQSLPMLPSSLCSLDARDCTLLERINLSNLKHLKRLDLVECSKLNEIEGLGGLESGEIIDVVGCDNLDQKRIFQEISKDFQNRDICEMYLSGSEIPEWFDFQSESPSSASCQVTLLHNMEIQGLIICTVHPSSEVPDLPDSIGVAVHNQSKNFTWIRYKHYDPRDHIWVIKMPHCVWKSIAECGDIVNVSAEYRFPGAFCSVKKIGVHLFYSSHERVSEEIPKQTKAFNALEYISYAASTS